MMQFEWSEANIHGTCQEWWVICSHDKLCNLSYRVKANLQLRLLKKKKEGKGLCWYKNITKRIATKYVIKIRRWQSSRLESKETLQNKDTASCKALRWSEDVLVRYFMILPPRAWIYKEKLSNFFSNGTCFKAIFSFSTFFSRPFILTITWQYAIWKSKISMHTLFSLLHCSLPAYTTYQILNHTSSKSKTN